MKDDDIFKLKNNPRGGKEYLMDPATVEWGDTKGLKYFGKKGLANCRGVEFTLAKSKEVENAECVFLRITPVTNARSPNCRIEIPLSALPNFLEELEELLDLSGLK